MQNAATNQIQNSIVHEYGPQTARIAAEAAKLAQRPHIAGALERALERALREDLPTAVDLITAVELRNPCWVRGNPLVRPLLKQQRRQRN